jgi:hypothetical protein
MKKLIFICLFLHSSLLAYTYDDVIKDYQAKRYKVVCLKSSASGLIRTKDENILSMIGDACAKVDHINPLAHVIRGLISTPEFRENGSYFATLVLQKKLIYQFMNDAIDLKNLRLPRSSHTLSIVFENLAKNNYKQEDGKIVIKLESKKYIVWITDAKKRVVHVDVYEDGQKIKTHWYL